MTVETDPFGKSTYKTYDAAGRQTVEIDRNGRKRTFEYDHEDRLVAEKWHAADGVTVVNVLTTKYDAKGRVVERTDDGAASVFYQYDERDRVTQVRSRATPTGIETKFDYTYDAADRLTRRTETRGTTAGPTEEYEYDELDRLTAITQTAGAGSGVAAGAAQRIEYQYDAVGRKTSETRYQGTTAVVYSTFGYDAAGRLAQIVHRKQTSSGDVIAQYDYAFDRAGRMISQNLLGTDEDAALEYDKSSQLTDADFDGQTDEEYAYDGTGNRTGYTVVKNRVTNDGTFTYTYDHEGNRLTRVRNSGTADDKTVEYAWDHRNRLTQVTLKNNAGTATRTVVYTYDALDRRIAQVVTGSGAMSERYVYSNGAEVQFVTDGSDAVTHRYAWGAGVDELLTEQTAGGLSFALTDHQQSVRDVVRYESGAVTLKNHIRYAAFGNIISQSDVNFTIRFTYTSQEFDVATGLNQYNARYYDALLAKFVSEDPKGFEAGYWNLTVYVGNNPFNLTDRRG